MQSAATWKGLDTSKPPHFISYDQTERMVAALMDRARAWQPDAVVGIARGGLVPASMAAALLALPLAMIAWDRETNAVTWLGERPSGRLLVVDDCCASGATMRAILAALFPQPTLSLTIVYDPETSGHIPDLSHSMREFFRLPWERGEATPAARARRALGEAANRVHEAAFIGIDLDGVFLPDISPAEYGTDLPAVLRARRHLAPFAVLPPFTASHAVIITGRPDTDDAQTLAWLAEHGHAVLPLQSRPAHLGDDLATVTRYKAEAATRWGCTHYIESDPEQAIRIAALAPHLLVSWWSAAATRQWMIGAAAAPPER